MKYRVKINKDKLEELKKQIKPGKSYWALFGIFFFFFLPEVIAYFYGNEIKEFFKHKELLATDNLHKLLYSQLKSLGENSYFNIIVGLVLSIWFFIERKRQE